MGGPAGYKTSGCEIFNTGNCGHQACFCGFALTELHSLLHGCFLGLVLWTSEWLLQQVVFSRQIGSLSGSAGTAFGIGFWIGVNVVDVK